MGDENALWALRRSNRDLYMAIADIRMLRLAKLTRVLKMGALMDALEEKLGVNPAFFKVVKPLIIMLFSAHIIAALFFNIGRSYDKCPRYASWVDNVCLWERDYSFTPWLYEANATAAPTPAPDPESCGNCPGKSIRQADRYTQYITSLYWAVATMTTVGYGDVGPSTEHKGGMVMVIISQVLGTMLFAYVVGIVIDIITNLDPIDRQRRQDLEIIREFIKDRDLPKALGKMLLYNHDWNVEFSSVFDEPTVLCVLPPHLRNQAYIFAHRQTLATCPLLCSQERAFAGSLSVIVPRLRTAAFVPGQIVNHPRYNCREFHMIVEGSVSITDRFVTEVNGTTKAKLDAECTVEVVGKRSHFGFSTTLLIAVAALSSIVP